MTQKASQDLVEVAVVAARFRVSSRSVYRLARDKKIPSYRVGRQLRFDLQEVSAALRIAA